MRKLFITVLLCSLMPAFSMGQGAEHGATATNIDVMRLLAGRVGDKIGTSFGSGDSVGIAVSPRESAWLIEGSIVQSLAAKGLRVSLGETAPFSARVGFTEGRVEYANPRRDGFFGSRLVDRKITLKLDVQATERATGRLVISSTMNEALVDSILISEVASVENPYVPTSRGTLPAEGFFSSIAEPIIFIGAAAVAILLLFSVRS